MDTFQGTKDLLDQGAVLDRGIRVRAIGRESLLPELAPLYLRAADVVMMSMGCLG